MPRGSTAAVGGLVTSAAHWPWSNLRRRLGAEGADRALPAPPGGLPEDWLEHVNRPESDAELAALRRRIRRGAPFGREAWVRRIAKEWNLQSTLRPCGRPSKTARKGS